MKLKYLLPAAALVALLALTGCIFSPDEGDDPPVINDGNTNTSQLQFPDTEDKLMKNFQIVYETMDYTHFLELLDPQYKTMLLEETINDWGLEQPFFNYDDEVSIHERIFSGDAVTDAHGTLQTGITKIQFSMLEREGVWNTTSPTHQYFPDARYALYDVEFYFFRGSEPALKVKGQIEFYLVSELREVDGVDKPYFRMIGQWDRTSTTL